MVFSSSTFLFAFLPVFLACYFIGSSLLPFFSDKNQSRNLIALLGSYVFYAWGAPSIVGVLFLSCLIDYYIGRRLAGERRRAWFILGVSLNAGFLGFYKYSNFFIGEVNRTLAVFSLEPIPWTAVALPIGISFFTFQKISYLSDVYRKTVEPSERFSDYALYVAFFPQLIAGPIIRYHDVARQLRDRKHSLHDAFYGSYRFCLGLGKKVLIANPLGAVADNVFALDATQLSISYAWLGLLCYSFQIYFDFSGYSDMAIGLGRLLGFRFLENFNFPYVSQTISEFWRRWHISLSNWMREYLYIPLGGNRVSTARLYCNLWIVFLLSGLWHGASWNFIFWGMFHGILLVIDRSFWSAKARKLPAAINIALTFFLVNLTWVLFRSASFPEALSMYSALFDFGSLFEPHPKLLTGQIIHNRGVFVLFLAAFISFIPLLLPKIVRSEDFVNCSSEREGFALALFRFSGAFACLVLSILSLSTTNYNPFIYFRF
jgi:alginate O-acetyltransferase complex protein AlgI